jgi:hypothetical protein
LEAFNLTDLTDLTDLTTDHRPPTTDHRPPTTRQSFARTPLRPFHSPPWVKL